MFLKYFYSSAAIMSKCLIFQYGYSVPVCVVLLHRKFQLCLGFGFGAKGLGPGLDNIPTFKYLRLYEADENLSGLS